MRWVLIWLVLFLVLLPFSVSAQGIVADHKAVDEFENIPDYWLEQAKQIGIHYAHTSHGMQVYQGLLYLEGNVDSTKYSFARREDATTPGLPPQESPPALRMYDGNPPETYIGPNDYWEGSSALDRTRAVLDTGDYDVSLFAWCGQMSSYPTSTVQNYLDAMTTLENEYQNVDFIYMTGHLAGSIQYDYSCNARQVLRRNNNMVRDYITSNDKILFDFADIESYNDGSTAQCTHNSYLSEVCSYPVE